MRVDQLDKRIEIFREQNKTRDLDAKPSNPTKVCKIWAKIRTLRGDETFIEQGYQGNKTHELVVRYRPELNSSMYIMWKGRRFDMRFIEEISGRERFMKIVAGERVI